MSASQPVRVLERAPKPSAAVRAATELAAAKAKLKETKEKKQAKKVTKQATKAVAAAAAAQKTAAAPALAAASSAAAAIAASLTHDSASPAAAVVAMVSVTNGLQEQLKAAEAEKKQLKAALSKAESKSAERATWTDVEAAELFKLRFNDEYAPLAFVTTPGAAKVQKAQWEKIAEKLEVKQVFKSVHQLKQKIQDERKKYNAIKRLQSQSGQGCLNADQIVERCPFFAVLDPLLGDLRQFQPKEALANLGYSGAAAAASSSSSSASAAAAAASSPVSSYEADERWRDDKPTPGGPASASSSSSSPPSARAAHRALSPSEENAPSHKRARAAHERQRGVMDSESDASTPKRARPGAAAANAMADLLAFFKDQASKQEAADERRHRELMQSLHAPLPPLPPAPFAGALFEDDESKRADAADMIELD